MGADNGTDTAWKTGTAAVSSRLRGLVAARVFTPIQLTIGPFSFRYSSHTSPIFR